MGHSELKNELSDLGEVTGCHDGFISITASKQALRQLIIGYYTKKHCMES